MNNIPSNEFIWGNFAEFQLDFALEISALVYGHSAEKKLPGNPVLSMEYFKNKHLDSPFGESIYIRKVEDDLMVGHIFLQKREFLNYGKTCVVLQASDLVSKSNRPLGGVKLFNKAKSISKESSIPFINLSNNDSNNIYERFLKMQPIVELDFRVALLNLNFANSYQRKEILNFGSILLRHIRKILIGKVYQFRIVDEFNEEIDRILNTSIEKCELIGKRNSKIINWRFNKANQKEYIRFQVTFKKEIVGYFVFTTAHYLDKEIVVLVDFFVNKPSKRLGIAALHYVAQAFSGANFFLVPCNTNSLMAIKTFRFSSLKVPRRFVPQRIPFYVTESNSNLSGALPRSHVTLFDTDIF
jgi:hypothetical protein